MSTYADVVKTFFTSSKVLDKKYRLIQQKVGTQKGRLTKKQTGLSEKLKKYVKDKEVLLQDF